MYSRPSLLNWSIVIHIIFAHTFTLSLHTLAVSASCSIAVTQQDILAVSAHMALYRPRTNPHHINFSSQTLNPESLTLNPRTNPHYHINFWSNVECPHRPPSHNVTSSSSPRRPWTMMTRLFAPFASPNRHPGRRRPHRYRYPAWRTHVGPPCSATRRVEGTCNVYVSP